MDGSLIPFLAIVISVGTFLASTLSYRQKAESDYVEILEKRISDLEKRMRECEETRKQLAFSNQELNQQNIDLLKRIVEVGIINKMKK